MTKQQMDFANEYLKTGKVMESALAAGYSKSYAHACSYKLLDNVCIAEYINKMMREVQKPTIATVSEILEYYSRVMRGEEKDQFGLDAPLSERTKAADALGKRFGLNVDQFKRDIEERKLKILETRGGIGDEDDEPVEIIDDIKADE